jgi:nucleotide-binding universal stress UspA family protein
MSLFRRSSISGSGTSPSHRTRFASQLELPPGNGGSILVAVDGKPRGWDALEWAAAEAASRRCLLRIVHAFRSSPALVGAPLALPVDLWSGSAFETAKGILSEAVTRARIVAPDIQITVCGRPGTATDAILRECKSDALIVLGHGRTSGRIGSAISVARRVSRRASSPVAVVTLAPSPVSGRGAGRVVAGLDGTENPVDVLDFAFRSAQRRGVGVTLIHAYPALEPIARWARPTDSMTAPSTPSSIEYLVRLCQETYPDVDLKQSTRPKCSSVSLIRESTGAAVLVVGAQRRRSRRVAFGLTRRDALQLAQSPVAIVRSSVNPANEGSEYAASDSCMRKLQPPGAK